MVMPHGPPAWPRPARDARSQDDLGQSIIPILGAPQCRIRDSVHDLSLSLSALISLHTYSLPA